MTVSAEVEHWRGFGSLAARALDRRPARLSALALCLAVAGCSARTIEGLPPRAYYATGFPLSDVSGELERLLPSVLRVQVRGFYDVYLFSEAGAPTEEEIGLGEAVLSRAESTTTSTLAQAATALLIGVNGRRGTLLTTDHGITLPDTTLVLFPSVAGGGGPRTVERIAIRRRQLSTVVGPMFVEPFDVLARSPGGDLAIIGVDVPEDVGPATLDPLQVTMGEPRRLSWGSLVYVIGHPAGSLMVTRAIVSRPELGSGDAFLTDGLVNEGASGAVILAVRGDTEELEWVGIARAAATRREQRLVPAIGSSGASRSDEPYDGPIYLREVEEIRYGISFSIPASEIREFLGEHRARLAEVGYSIPLR